MAVVPAGDLCYPGRSIVQSSPREHDHLTYPFAHLDRAGGGSDLASYYRENGGFFISAAIDQYVHIGINRSFAHDYHIRYSAQEHVSSVGEIKHPIVREVLLSHPIGPVEIVSLADVPAGTGLGSSGSFTVGLLRAALRLQARDCDGAGPGRGSV